MVMAKLFVQRSDLGWTIVRRGRANSSASITANMSANENSRINASLSNIMIFEVQSWRLFVAY
jgi:hypothetical protein